MGDNQEESGSLLDEASGEVGLPESSGTWWTRAAGDAASTVGEWVWGEEEATSEVASPDRGAGGRGDAQPPASTPDLFLDLMTKLVTDTIEPVELAARWPQLSQAERDLLLDHPKSGPVARRHLGLPEKAPAEEATSLLQRGLNVAAGAASDLAGLGAEAYRSASDWLGAGDAGSPSEESAAPEAAAPQVAADAEAAQAPDGPAAEVASGRDVYLNQLDNQTNDTASQSNGGTKHVGGSVMCNVTTLAMQAVAIAGGGEQGHAHAKSVMAEVLADKCGHTVSEAELEGAQLGDLAFKRFNLWSRDEWRPYIDANAYRGFFDECVDLVHQNHLALTLVLQELVAHGIREGASAEWVSTTKGPSTKDRQTPEHLRDYVKPILDDGGVVSMGTKLSGGHVVLLADVLSDGILIQDPYGLKLKNAFQSDDYIRNDDSRQTAQSKLSTFDSTREILARRSKHNASLSTALADDASGPLPADLGRLNFYSFDEVKEFDMTWRTIIKA